MAGRDAREETGFALDLTTENYDAGHQVPNELHRETERRQDVLAHAEASLYDHLVVTPGGLCVGCSEPEPCRARYAAYDVFNSIGVLPRRRAGVAGVYMAGGIGRFDGFATAQTRSNEAM